MIHETCFSDWVTFGRQHILNCPQDFLHREHANIIWEYKCTSGEGVWYNELWNQTCGVSLTAQSFTSFAYVASFSNFLSFSVFICENSWAIPPFQVDVTSSSDNAFKASGFPRLLLNLSSPLFPITFLLVSETLFTSVRWFTNRYCAAQTHVCVCTSAHSTHTHIILSAQSKQFRITALHSQLCSLHSTSFSASSPGKETPRRMDRKRKWHCRGREEATLIKETPKSPGRSENLTRPENGRLGRIRWENNMEADHGGLCRPCTGGPSSPLDRQPWNGTTEQDDTVWFVSHCMLGVDRESVPKGGS